MSDVALQLTKELIGLGLPIDGVSIGNNTDPSTWKISWISEPTPEHLTMSSEVVVKLIEQPQQETKESILEQQALDLFNQQPLMKALVMVLSKQAKLTPAALTDLVIEQHIKNLSPQPNPVVTPTLMTRIASFFSTKG